METELLQIRAGQRPIAIVVTDSEAGEIVRYEVRDGNRKRTHHCVVRPDIERPIEFPYELVSEFRTHPLSEFAVTGPAPVPGGDNPGGTPAAARVA